MRRWRRRRVVRRTHRFDAALTDLTGVIRSRRVKLGWYSSGSCSCGGSHVVGGHFCCCCCCFGGVQLLVGEEERFDALVEVGFGLDLQRRRVQLRREIFYPLVGDKETTARWLWWLPRGDLGQELAKEASYDAVLQLRKQLLSNLKTF